LRQLNNNPETFMKAQRPIVMFAWENALTLRKRNEAVSRQQTRHRQLHEQGETNAKGNAGTKRLNNGVFCGVMLSFPNGYRFLGFARLTAVWLFPDDGGRDTKRGRPTRKVGGYYGDCCGVHLATMLCLLVWLPARVAAC